MNDELIRAGDAWAVEQRINHKRGVIRFRRFKPEGSKIRELFRRIRKGIYRQAAGGQPVLIGLIHGAEVAGAQERHDVAARQFRGFEGAETGEPEIRLSHQLRGVDACVVIVEQRRAKVNFTRLTGGRIEGEHTHPAAEPHSHVEELDVELTARNIVPQRMFRIVLNAVVRLGG